MRPADIAKRELIFTYGLTEKAADKMLRTAHDRKLAWIE
jgi:hypothetical protein